MSASAWWNSRKPLHVVPADVPDKIRTGFGIPDGDTEMMVGIACVLRDIRPRAREDEDAGFPVVADLVVRECRAAVRPVDHGARQDAFRGPAGGDRADGIEHIDGRVLIASDIAKGDS